MPASVEVKKGLDTELFYDYLAFIQDMREKRAPIDSRAQDSTITEAEMAQLKQDMAVLNLQVEAEQDRIQEDYGHTLFAKMIKMVREPEVPDAPMDAGQPPVVALLQVPGHVLGPCRFFRWQARAGPRLAQPSGPILEWDHAAVARYGVG